MGGGHGGLLLWGGGGEWGTPSVQATPAHRRRPPRQQAAPRAPGAAQRSCLPAQTLYLQVMVKKQPLAEGLTVWNCLSMVYLAICSLYCLLVLVREEGWG